MTDANSKSQRVFESLAAVNERFEKFGVLESIDGWQECQTARNLAAHDYETDYARVAQRFNMLHASRAELYGTAARFTAWCENQLGIFPASDHFAAKFSEIIRLQTQPGV